MSESRITYPLKHTVIAGGGPAGLFLAAMLAKKGVKDVTVLMDRGDNVTRAGDYNEEVVTKICRYLGINDFKTYFKIAGYRFQIKDAERGLIKYLEKNTQVTLIKGASFKSVSSKGVTITQPSNAGDATLPCHLLIDCTGTKRVVIKEINQQHQQQSLPMPFSIAAVGENPEKHIMLMRVNIKSEDCYKFNDNYGSAPPATTQQTITALRELGWPYWSLPKAYINVLGKDKGNLYSTVPELKSDEERLSFAQTLFTHVDIANFSLMKESKKGDAVKPRISQFVADPQHTSPLYYVPHAAGFPVVVHHGDATIDNIPVLASGVWGNKYINGQFKEIGAIERIRVFINNITLSPDGEIDSINFAKYNTEMDELIQHQIAIIKEQYRGSLMIHDETKTQITAAKARIALLTQRAAYDREEKEATLQLQQIRKHLKEILMTLPVSYIKQTLTAFYNWDCLPLAEREHLNQGQIKLNKAILADFFKKYDIYSQIDAEIIETINHYIQTKKLVSPTYCGEMHARLAKEMPTLPAAQTLAAELANMAKRAPLAQTYTYESLQAAWENLAMKAEEDRLRKKLYHRLKLWDPSKRQPPAAPEVKHDDDTIKHAPAKIVI